MSKMLNNEKVYSDGTMFVKISEVLPSLIADVVDSRYKYLKELDFENHKYARKILEEEYNPAVERLSKILETIA